MAPAQLLQLAQQLSPANLLPLHLTCCVCCRYAAILFKKQKYVSGQHRVNLKIVCKENYKYEVQEKSPANQGVTMQQLAEEYWRYIVFIICNCGIRVGSGGVICV